MSWFVVYTKPRNELKVAKALEEAGITVYCPVITTVKQWSDRKKKVTVPLFSSYVFVQVHDKERALVFQVPGVVRYLFWLGKPAVVRDYEIEAIQQALQEQYTGVTVQGIKPGDTIVLEEGVFKGQRAIFKEQRGKKTIVILESIGLTLILEK